MSGLAAAFETVLLAQIEDAGINASAPPEQRWVDGWLVRYSPGKAKRARCIQAVAAGRLPVAAKLARCLPIYAASGLRPYVRITPFSLPEDLDEELAGMGMERIDDTRVMAMPLAAPRLAPPSEPEAGSTTLRSAGAAEFAAWVGAARGSSPTEIEAHVARITGSPVPHHAVLLSGVLGEPAAGGQSVIEGDVVGLYDVFTLPASRRRGHAETVCRALLDHAQAAGARFAYLQVDSANETARSVYRRIGFADAYGYHYRTPPERESPSRPVP